MRAFIALTLPDAAREALARHQAALRAAGGDAVRWTPVEQLHLTIRFLGDTDRGLIDPLLDVLRHAAADTAPMAADTLASVGAFPHLGAPQVLWIGIGEGAQAITQLAQRIDEGVVALGAPPEHRAFHPHITLGRVKAPAQARRIGQALEASPQHLERVPFRCDRLVLMESALTPQGPVHTPLGETRLVGKT